MLVWLLLLLLLLLLQLQLLLKVNVMQLLIRGRSVGGVGVGDLICAR